MPFTIIRHAGEMQHVSESLHTHGLLHQMQLRGRFSPLNLLQGMNLSVESLHAAMQRVRSEVLQPYGTIRMQTTQMSNLHRTTDMLRHVLHRLKLIAKLKVQLLQWHANFLIEIDSALSSHAIQAARRIELSHLHMKPTVYMGPEHLIDPYRVSRHPHIFAHL